MIDSSDNRDFTVGGVGVDGDGIGRCGGENGLGAAVAELENQHYGTVAALDGGEVLDVGAREVVGGVVPSVRVGGCGVADGVENRVMDHKVIVHSGVATVCGGQLFGQVGRDSV